MMTITPPNICTVDTRSCKINIENIKPKTGTRFIRDTEILAESFLSPKLYNRNATIEQPTLR